MSTATAPAAGECAQFAVGDKVYLRGCPFGEPGRVLRIERSKLAILWPDLGNYIGRHTPESLVLAEEDD